MLLVLQIEYIHLAVEDLDRVILFFVSFQGASQVIHVLLQSIVLLIQVFVLQGGREKKLALIIFSFFVYKAAIKGSEHMLVVKQHVE